MSFTLESFSTECHRILKADPGRAGREKVRDLVQEALKDEQFFCEEQGTPFTKHNDMQVLQRRYEKQQVEADE